jgi:hypothetical protein
MKKSKGNWDCKTNSQILSGEVDGYEKQLQEILEITTKEKQKEECIRKINELKECNIDEWNAKKLILEKSIHGKNNQRNSLSIELGTKEREMKDFRESYLV